MNRRSFFLAPLVALVPAAKPRASGWISVELEKRAASECLRRSYVMMSPPVFDREALHKIVAEMNRSWREREAEGDAEYASWGGESPG